MLAWLLMTLCHHPYLLFIFGKSGRLQFVVTNLFDIGFVLNTLKKKLGIFLKKKPILMTSLFLLKMYLEFNEIHVVVEI